MALLHHLHPHCPHFHTRRLQRGEGPGAPQQQFPILPPAVGDEYESEGSEGEDDEARPFTRGELQQRVLKTVEKRETAAKKEGFKYDLTVTKSKDQKKQGGRK